MFQRLFFTVYDSNNVATGTRLQIIYGNSVVKEWNFPVETEMTEDEQDAFVAEKFGELFA